MLALKLRKKLEEVRKAPELGVDLDCDLPNMPSPEKKDLVEISFAAGGKPGGESFEFRPSDEDEAPSDAEIIECICDCFGLQGCSIQLRDAEGVLHQPSIKLPAAKYTLEYALKEVYTEKPLSFRLERLTDGLSLNDHGKLVDPACLGDLKDSFGASRVETWMQMALRGEMESVICEVLYLQYGEPSARPDPLPGRADAGAGADEAGSGDEDAVRVNDVLRMEWAQEPPRAPCEWKQSTNTKRKSGMDYLFDPAVAVRVVRVDGKPLTKDELAKLPHPRPVLLDASGKRADPSMLYLKTDGVWRDDGTFEFLEMGITEISRGTTRGYFTLAVMLEAADGTRACMLLWDSHMLRMGRIVTKSHRGAWGADSKRGPRGPDADHSGCAPSHVRWEDSLSCWACNCNRNSSAVVVKAEPAPSE